mmetsp:Transcript_14930/g.13118  ORF Transcript_14930/g.13118 Transcript_14930/m.13118 type:complete len:132 (+) Transcript_14930:121-516(+)|eukprot:CAMPEP_0205802440 /NCGR_PEP_ID=MMETSP0205-20121125/4742_1 /ASSEMBLY_ACC=CAM_ASM_000278 /TAXON_ID=36767 /ORGANISM="Euplotes focardii, Strain TN1" /LENGTH=131 /DNA_ID=CAMNT_0053068817 /DNA_START=56 /DNA_END=451 /DNA_ORIENTATION=-
MIPISTQDQLKTLNKSEPNQPLQTKNFYDNKLLSNSDISCLKACSNKLGYLESKKINFDSNMENSTMDGQDYKALNSIPKAEMNTREVDIHEIFKGDLTTLQRTTLTEFQALMKTKRNKESLILINEISKD